MNHMFSCSSMEFLVPNQMFLRIQTVDDVPAQDVLKKGLQDLKIICGMTRQTFNQEMKKFEAKSQR
ncbi:hypothetical protein TCAL_16628 [Tigriopus californicus]|uniref:Uncharacterized protein n=1 Tax=Tigriopus californicus TaxID=6832 RepID=A0A553ND30_TIGCA|nr:hypothetical protein TCAL_16628 [Tigriopus californicus]